MWRCLCLKLDDGSASTMRRRQLISKTNYNSDQLLWTHVPEIYNRTKRHFGELAKCSDTPARLHPQLYEFICLLPIEIWSMTFVICAYGCGAICYSRETDTVFVCLYNRAKMSSVNNAWDAWFGHAEWILTDLILMYNSRWYGILSRAFLWLCKLLPCKCMMSTSRNL